MAAFRIAAQMIAYQPVEAIEILPHVRRADRNIDPRRRSKPEHQLRPVQYGQQTSQCLRIESTTNFDPTSASQFNHKNTVAHGNAVDIMRHRGNHFDGNKRHASRLPSTMHALTIFIQRPYGQAPLLAKNCTPQSTRFKLPNQALDLGQTTAPAHHSHFAHTSSRPLNAAQEQSALLRRIRFIAAGAPAAEWTVIEPRKEGIRYSVDEGNGLCYIRINDTNPSYRLVTVPVSTPKQGALDRVDRLPQGRAP